MYKAADFCRELARLGTDFFTGVPDTVIENLCNYLNGNPPAGGHVQAANEGGAVGLAAGRYLATGKIPAVYMQNSGLGNAVNPLLSLADREVYALPLLLLVGWRGQPGRHDEPQHLKQGRVTEALLAAMEIPWSVAGPDWDETAAAVATAYDAMRARPGPYALLFPKGCFEPEPAAPDAGYGTEGLTRENAIAIIAERAGGGAAVVASTGMGPRELYELRERLGEGHERDFLNAGAMGHASMIALGIARARPERRVVCLDGDGALLMHLGALAVAGGSGCRNLVHFLLNNGVHDSVGGQPNLAMRVDLAEVAAACGYRRVFRIENGEALRNGLDEIFAAEGPVFAEVRLARGFRKDLGRPGIPFATAGEQFREFLTGESRELRGHDF